MNEAQLNVWANMIANAMKAGDMGTVSEIYNKFSGIASMTDAANVEKLIAAAMNG